KDVRVRQAFNYLWNYKAYSELQKGLAEPSDGALAASLIAPSKGYNPYTYDVDKAKALLREAGGQPGAKFSWCRSPGSDEARYISEIMQIELQKLGYVVEIIEAPLPAAIDKWIAFHKEPTGDPPSASIVFGQPRYADPYSIAYLFYSCALV